MSENEPLTEAELKGIHQNIDKIIQEFNVSVKRINGLIQALNTILEGLGVTRTSEGKENFPDE